MYRPYHVGSVGSRGDKGGSAQRPGGGKPGSLLVAYLFGFFCTDIFESPSTDKGDSGLDTGAVGIEVGLSPSSEMGEEGWSGPEVTGAPLCGRGFLRTGGVIGWGLGLEMLSEWAGEPPNPRGDAMKHPGPYQKIAIDRRSFMSIGTGKRTARANETTKRVRIILRRISNEKGNGEKRRKSWYTTTRGDWRKPPVGSPFQ